MKLEIIYNPETNLSHAEYMIYTLWMVNHK